MTELLVENHLGQMQSLLMFKDEPIPMVFNADDYTNIAERSSTYSKTFELPGNKSNNSFFSFYYNVQVDGTFDPHKRRKCTLQENTIIVFEGWLQLINVVIKNDNEISYEVTIFSDIVNIKDTLDQLTLRDLVFDELDHNFTITEIEASWTTGVTYLNPANANGFRAADTVKYPWGLYSDAIYLDTDNAGTEFIHTFSIYSNSSIQNNEYIFRPWVKVDYLFKTIIKNAGYNFNSSFMSTTTWTKLYCDFAAIEGQMGNGREKRYGVSSTAFGTTYTKVNFSGNISQSVGGMWSPGTYYNAAADEIIIPPGFGNTQIYVMMYMKVKADVPVNQTLGVRVRMMTYDASTGITSMVEDLGQHTITNTGSSVNNGYSSHNWFSIAFPYSAQPVFDVGDRVWVEAKTTTSTAQFGDTTDTGDPLQFSSIYYNLMREIVSLDDILYGSRGDISQWAFIKNLVSMFNLVITLNDDDSTMLEIEPYDDFIDTGTRRDWSHKVDVDSVELTPIEGLAKDVLFRHSEDSDDMVTKMLSQPNEWKWPYLFESGDDLYDEKLEIIETTDFASTHCAGVFGTDLYAPHIMNESGEIGWNNVMRILYDNGVTTSGTPYGPGQDPAVWKYDYLQFTPVNIFPPTASAVSIDYGEVQYTPTTGAVLNGLYNEYWRGYIDELYHKDTRVVKMKIFLSGYELRQFKFNDVITIHNVNYRVQSIDYSGDGPAMVELITIKNL